MDFPREFPIKVMGANQADFESLVLSIIQKHAHVVAEEMVVSRVSRNGIHRSQKSFAMLRAKSALDFAHGADQRNESGTAG
jgi:putative lipoic acid-binding regulatory protein